MHPRLEELAEHIDRHRAELRAAVAGVPANRLAVTPSDTQWSVLGVLEHLAIVESRVGAALQRTINEARANGVAAETEETPILPTLDLGPFIDRTKKIKTSEVGQPKAGLSLGQLWQTLDETHETLRSVMHAADGMKLSEVTMPHPVFGAMNLYEWFAWVGSHEARHAAQIREIGECVGRQSLSSS
jgi:hypothetical protein